MLIPLVLAVFGADYLAPRNLVAAMIPVTALIAVIVTRRPERAGPRAAIALAATIALAFLAISLDVDLSPRLQRGDWRGRRARARAPAGARARDHDRRARRGAAGVLPAAVCTTCAPGTTVRVSEIDETGYAPLRASAPAGRRRPAFTCSRGATSTG